MREIEDLFDKNKAWAEQVRREDPGCFRRLSHLQHPEYLWIGCSDSRVPANQIVGLMPGEIFVHRNVANLVVHSDLNCLSVLQFAIDVLKVRHVLVVGHYGCGGVRAALEDQPLGLIDNWLRHIQDIGRTHKADLDACHDVEARHARLCELNVIEQADNVCETTVVRQAWARGQTLSVHAWIYDLGDGLMKDLGFSARSEAEAAAVYRTAITTRHRD